MAAERKKVLPRPGSFQLVAGMIALVAIFYLSIVVEGDMIELDAERLAQMSGVLKLNIGECIYVFKNHSIFMGNISLAMQWLDYYDMNTLLNYYDIVKRMENDEPYTVSPLDYKETKEDLLNRTLTELNVKFPNTTIQLLNGPTDFSRSISGYDKMNHFIARTIHVTDIAGNSKWTAGLVIDAHHQYPTPDNSVPEVTQFGLCGRIPVTGSN